MEHLAFNASQRKDWNIHNRNNQNPENARLNDFCSRLGCQRKTLLFIQQSSQPVLFHPKTPQTVFNDNDRTIDNQAEIQRAKAHQISYATDGGLLQELFTADGAGTQLVEEKAHPVRAAMLDDVGDIVEIIRPLEESGALVRRSRDRLEQEIDQFLVAELDGVIVGCCAVYPNDEQAELACVAVSGLYQRGSAGVAIGANLLAAAEQHARTLGAKELFVLTTQTQEWFLERSFRSGDVEDLPTAKQSLYNWQRGSKVLFKSLG